VYIIFLGAPGAGKGTQAAIMAKEFNLVHIASGDLFRQAIEQETELAMQAKSYMEKGKLVPDEITIQMVLEDKVVYIKVSEEELTRRLSGRWICRNCQTPYHSTSSPPKIWGECDRCGGELYQRSDDTPATVKARLKVYFAETAPLIDYYTQSEKLLEIDGEGEINEISGRIALALRKSLVLANNGN